MSNATVVPTEWVKAQTDIVLEQPKGMSALMVLTKFFNVGDGAVSAAEWRKEVMALGTDARKSLAAEVVAVTGWDMKQA